MTYKMVKEGNHWIAIVMSKCDVVIIHSNGVVDYGSDDRCEDGIMELVVDAKENRLHSQSQKYGGIRFINKKEARC